MVFTLRWGILACGGIAEKFSRDLLINPATRKVSDVAHVIQAVGSSSSVQKAKSFADKITDNKQHSIKAYGSYEELVKDPDVDIIYVASPHSHHYPNCLLCLNHGKHVLCEKPFTINGKQTAHLIKLAKEKRLFLAEAVWTRHFELTLALQKLIHQDRILGKIHRVFSDFGLYFERDPKHRLFAPELGGGALLDLGIYALTWQMITLHQDPDNQRQAPTVASLMMKTPLTNVDEFTAMILNWDKMHAQGIATTNMSVQSNKDAVVTIQGDKGYITVQWAPFRPESFTIHLDGKQPDKRTFEIPGHGMFWEADDAARCVRDGKIESSVVPLADSQMTMDIMDKVRKDNNFFYPKELEASN